MGRRGGRREWSRVARRELEAQREREAQPIPRDREDRLFQALGRLEENHRVELAANEAYERWRATARDTKGRVLKGNSKPFAPPEVPDGTINLSDPDSRVMRTKGPPPRQAYNAQAAVNEQQIILAAEITVDAAGLRAPRADARHDARAPRRHGVTEQPEVVLADAGYWHTRQIAGDRRDRGSRCSSRRTARCARATAPAGRTALYELMRDKLTPTAAASSTRSARSRSSRSSGRSNTTGAIDRFMRRGRAAAQSEWRLVAATHNLLKLHSHWIANTA